MFVALHTRSGLINAVDVTLVLMHDRVSLQNVVQTVVEGGCLIGARGNRGITDGVGLCCEVVSHWVGVATNRAVCRVPLEVDGTQVGQAVLEGSWVDVPEAVFRNKEAEA